jgi:hypothetical protein
VGAGVGLGVGAGVGLGVGRGVGRGVGGGVGLFVAGGVGLFVAAGVGPFVAAGVEVKVGRALPVAVEGTDGEAWPDGWAASTPKPGCGPAATDNTSAPTSAMAPAKISPRTATRAQRRRLRGSWISGRGSGAPVATVRCGAWRETAAAGGATVEVGNSPPDGSSSGTASGPQRGPSSLAASEARAAA